MIEKTRFNHVRVAMLAVAWVIGAGMLSLPAPGHAASGGAAAEAKSQAPNNSDAGAAPIANPRQTRMPNRMKGVTITQNLGDRLPLDVEMTTSSGEEVTLRRYFENNDSKPVILNLAYYECPQLCSLVMEGTAKSVRKLGWVPGKQFKIVTLSIDPGETPRLARQKKKEMVGKLAMQGETPGEGWHFHTATKGEIERLAKAAGFGYKYLPQQDQYVHKPAIILVSPDGKISRYLKGIQYPSFKLKGSLIDASNGKVGSVVDKIVMSCFQYQELEGKYAASAMGFMRLGGAVTLFIVVAVIGVALLREAIRRYHGTDEVVAESDASNP